jgi:CDP-diacylglycerol pyrophosphatase
MQVSEQLHTLVETALWQPLNRELDGHQYWFGCFEEKTFASARNQNTTLWSSFP